MEGDRISPLESHWQPLEQVRCFPGVFSDNSVIRLPSSCTNSTARLFQVPAVSMATGTKMWLLASCLYLVSLLEAALSAATPVVVAMSSRYESAYVSGSVTSHANGLPFAQGSSVTPSGRLPSSRLRAGGSFTAGTCAVLKARYYYCNFMAFLVILSLVDNKLSIYLSMGILFS